MLCVKTVEIQRIFSSACKTLSIRACGIRKKKKREMKEWGEDS